MQEFYHKWYSQHLGREFEMLVFGHSGIPIILFPAAKGRYFQTKDFGLIHSVEDYINEGKVKIYCPDTIDEESWFNFNIEPSERIARQLLYENLIMDEVIGFAKYETEFDRVGLAGCDLGAYQAVNFAFKHPELISHIFTMGGTFDIKRFVHGFYDDQCYYNSPLDYFPGLQEEKYLNPINNIKIMIGSGEYDLTLDENKYFSKILNEKNFLHRFDVLPEADHNWPWWRHMFYYFIKDLEN